MSRTEISVKTTFTSLTVDSYWMCDCKTRFVHPRIGRLEHCMDCGIRSDAMPADPRDVIDHLEDELRRLSNEKK